MTHLISCSSESPEDREGITELGDVGILEEEVQNIRKRSIDVLERILALPDPPKKQHTRRRSSMHSHTKIFEETETEKMAAVPAKDEVITTAAFLQEQLDIELPDPMERYENRLNLLNQELERLTQYNCRLKARIRDIHMKLRDAKADEEKLSEQFKLSMQQRIFMMPTSLK